MDVPARSRWMNIKSIISRCYRDSTRRKYQLSYSRFLIIIRFSHTWSLLENITSSIIFDFAYTIKQTEKSFFDMWEDGVWKVIKREPTIFRMDIFFEIFRTSNPAITEEEYEIPITIDIFGMNGNFSNDIYLIDMDSCFFKEFPFCSFK